MKDFDKIFSDYLETYEADEIFDSLFAAIRKAYMAGYKAAGGKISVEQPLLTLVKYKMKRLSSPEGE